MIAHLSGTVLGTRGKALILQTGGIGYLVHTNKKLLIENLHDKKLELFIHTHQTSDTTSLYGFATEHELSFFELLRTVNGVGPKTALEILETPIAEVENLIAGGDAKAFGHIPGVGPKTAGRIVLELKNKISDSSRYTDKTFTPVSEEVLTALSQLGYEKSQISKKLAELPKNLKLTEDIITWFLRSS